jgi:WD40 repeat protein
VNAIAFHRIFGTFATCGSDGTFHFWDKDSKTRLKAFQKCSLPITAGIFNAFGNLFAYSIGYDWSKVLDIWSDYSKVKTTTKKANQIFLESEILRQKD